MSNNMIKPFSILCVLHHPRLACDRALIGQLKGRTLGNGVSRLRASLVEQHSRDWMARAIEYMSVLRKLRGPGVAAQGDVSLPAFVKVPGLTWFGRVYVLEAMTRLEETKARVTSIFGEILKMDSTKKVRRLSPPPRLRTLRPLCLNVCVCVCVCVCVFVSCRWPKSWRVLPPGRPPGCRTWATSTGRCSCPSSRRPRGTDSPTWRPA